MSQTSYNPPAMDIIQEEINDTHMTTLDPTSIKRSREPNAEPEISNKISLSEQQCSTMDIITMDNNDNYSNYNIGTPHLPIIILIMTVPLAITENLHHRRPKRSHTAWPLAPLPLHMAAHHASHSDASQLQCQVPFHC